MTAPFAPPPPWEVKAFILGMLALMAVLPFAGHEGWPRRLALVLMAVLCVGLWTLLIRGWVRAIREWWRDRAAAGGS